MKFRVPFSTAKVFLGLVFFFLFFIANGQQIVDNELSKLFAYATPEKIDYSKPLKKSTNEIKMLLSATFLFYKKFISSQDKPSCVFSPSCSVYAIKAFQKKGFFLGWLYTFDRLSRCHPLVKPTHYKYNSKIQRYEDPID